MWNVFHRFFTIVKAEKSQVEMRKFEGEKITMKKTISSLCLWVSAIAFGNTTTNAQIKIPKIFKPKVNQPGFIFSFRFLVFSFQNSTKWTANCPANFSDSVRSAVADNHAESKWKFCGKRKFHRQRKCQSRGRSRCQQKCRTEREQRFTWQKPKY
jgi:hypothetical protein